MAASDLTSHVSERQNPKPYAGGKIEKCHRGDPGLGPAWAGKASDADAPGCKRDAIRSRPPHEKTFVTTIPWCLVGFNKECLILGVPPQRN